MQSQSSGNLVSHSSPETPERQSHHGPASIGRGGTKMGDKDVVASEGILHWPIPTYDKLTYEDFLRHHLIANLPCFFSADFTASWRSVHDWRDTAVTAVEGTNGAHQPDLDGLKPYAHHTVPVADTSKRQFSEFERTDRPLGEVLNLWKKEEGQGLYVKDWHLFQQLESEGFVPVQVYSVPECLRDDWLNPWFTPCMRENSHEGGDFRFCYVGPPGTFTPLHRDVYASYSWSANVVGRKHWWLFPPDKVEGLKKNGELVFDVRELPDEGNGIKVIQEEGEIIFVPSGWHHQVMNLDFCISINHNFASSPTLPYLYKALEEAQTRVERSIEDVKAMIQERVGTDGPWEKEWVEEVQSLLEKDAGWGWKGFWETVLRNLQSPPTIPRLSPSREMCHSFVRTVVESYLKRREWGLLPETRTDVKRIMDIIR